MYQTEGSWCIKEAANLANSMEMKICTATDIGNVGGEGELGIKCEAEILPLFDRRERRVTNKWEGGNKMGRNLNKKRHTWISF